MPTKTRLGIRCKTYVNSATYGSPVWVEANAINDWKQNVGWGKADGVSRAGVVVQSAKTDLTLSWTGTVKNDGSQGSTVILDALLSNMALDCLVLLGPKDEVGVTGFRVDCQLFKADEDQGRQGVVYEDVELMPTFSDNPPKAVKVASGGTLTYAPITGDALTYA